MEGASSIQQPRNMTMQENMAQHYWQGLSQEKVCPISKVHI